MNKLPNKIIKIKGNVKKYVKRDEVYQFTLYLFTYFFCIRNTMKFFGFNS